MHRAPHTRGALSQDAFVIVLREEYKSMRCLHIPRLAPTEYAGTIRYGSVRSLKFEFPEMRKVEAVAA